MRTVMVLLLALAAIPCLGLEAETIWERDFEAKNISGWGARKISATDFIVVGNKRERSLTDTLKLFIQRMKTSGDTVWQLRFEEIGITGYFPRPGGIEALIHGDGTYTLLCPLEDADEKPGISVFRFDDAGALLSRDLVGIGYDQLSFAQDGRNVFVVGVKQVLVSAGKTMVPVLLKYDMRMRLLDSLYLRDTTDCRSEGSFTTGDALTLRNDTLHIVGNQGCQYRSGGVLYASNFQVHATFGTDLNAIRSRRYELTLATGFNFKGVAPVRNGVIAYGGFSGSRTHTVALLGEDTVMWKTEFTPGQAFFDTHASILESGAILWCGNLLDCRLFDPNSGKQMDSTLVTPGYSEHGTFLRTLRVDGSDFIVVSQMAGGTQVGRFRFEYPAARVLREAARPRQESEAKYYQVNGRRVGYNRIFSLPQSGHPGTVR